jgi:hypothetical protein
VTGVDGYDWSIFGGNPVPGDPDAVRAISLNRRDLADRVAQQNALVRSVGSDAESIWVGPAADRFRPHVGKLPGQLSKLTGSYHDAADALDGFWPRLRDAQDLAVQALSKATAAQGAIAAAQGQVTAASAGADSAASSYNQAAMAAAGTPAATPEAAAATQAQLHGLQAGYQQAQSQVAAAAAGLSAANADMAAAHTMKDTAATNAHVASGACASCLHAASAAGIQNPHNSWLSGVFDDIGHVASGAFHWSEHAVEEGLKAAEPILADVSAGLGIASAILAVAGLLLSPFGVGEVIEAVNEGLIGLKTADDALLLAAGDKEAGTMLAEDGLALATGGLGRVFSDAGEVAVASGEVTEAGSKLAASTDAVTAASSRLSSAAADATAAGSRAEAAGSDAMMLRGMQSDAMAQGDTVNAVSFGLQADAKLADQAGAVADQQAAQVEGVAAQGGLDQATTDLGASNDAYDQAVAGQTMAAPYSPLEGPASLAQSFSGANNVDRATQFAANPIKSISSFADANGLSGGPAQRFVQYYSNAVTGSPGVGRLGGALKTVSIGINVHEGIHGVNTLSAAAAGGGGGG